MLMIKTPFRAFHGNQSKEVTFYEGCNSRALFELYILLSNVIILGTHINLIFRKLLHPFSVKSSTFYNR